MPNPYQAQVNLAARLIKAKGQQMTLFRVSVGEYNAITPEEATPYVSAQGPAVGVVLPASNGTIDFDDRILTDPSRRQSFRFVILAADGLPFRPQAEDILLTVEGAYRLLGATALDPSGQGAIIFNCGCTLDTQFVVPGAEKPVNLFLQDDELVLPDGILDLPDKPLNL